MRPYRFRQPLTPGHYRPPASTRRVLRIDQAVAFVVAAMVFGSGLLNLISLMGGPVPTGQPPWLLLLFPLDYAGVSRTLTLLSGFALILAAIHLWSYKRRAWQLAIALAGGSVAFHLTRGWNIEEASSSAVLLAILLLARRGFQVGSEKPRLSLALRRAGAALAITASYGAVGFWLLERKEFHQEFHWWQAAIQTLRLMIFAGDPNLIPHTPYAAWFLDSLFWMSAASFLYSGFVLFRPVAYRFQLDGQESALASAIAERYGNSAQDYFKHFADKSFFFSQTRKSFLGYRVSGHYALVLGDPVGPSDEVATTIAEFVSYCRSRGWRVGFHQVSAETLPLYEALGFHSFKVGDDAIVDLNRFTLSGSAMKEARNTVNRLDRLGYTVERIDPPMAGPMLEELKRISDQWLEIPGHRERQFTLGRFERWYVESTPVYVAFDPGHHAVAFLNLVPSYRTALATVDLMRRTPHQINGLMDFLFTKVFLDLRGRGFRQFSLGMAPLSGDAGEPIRWEERLAHWAIKRLPFLFRADSLRRFKAKYADSWRPRYAVYEHRLDLPRLVMALRRVSELPKRPHWRAA